MLESLKQLLEQSPVSARFAVLGPACAFVHVSIPGLMFGGVTDSPREAVEFILASLPEDQRPPPATANPKAAEPCQN